ncbi:MAG: alpha/beta fold hydrolase, partial [Deltaproteobacteria bacterium]|nr:alpha/beta fold hydrolase [Deltaproteobacteria bacterium]
ALAERFQVITFDNRGVGGSTVPSEPFTIDDMAADVVGLLDHLGIDKAHLFGVSMGGLITQVLTLDYPGRVGKAVLGCTSHGGRHAVQPGREVMEILGSISVPGVSAQEATHKRLPLIFSDRFIREEPEKVEGFVARSLQYQPTPQGAAGQMKALIFFNVKRRLGEIRCPVLVMTGDEDRMMPPENARARRYVVKGAGHCFCLESSKEVNRVLLDFFKE